MLAVPEFFVGGHFSEAEVHIPMVLRGDGALNHINIGNENHFTLLHEFDMASHVLQSVIKDITGFTTGLVFKGADTVVSTTKDIIKSITGAAGSASSAQAQAMRIQGQFTEAADNIRLAQYHQIFGLDAIVVTRVGQGIQVYTWATPNTPAHLAAFNEEAGTNYTFSGFVNSPQGAYSSFENLATGTNGSVRIDRISTIAGVNRNQHPTTFIPELKSLLNQQQHTIPTPNQNQQQNNSQTRPTGTGSDLEFRR